MAYFRRCEYLLRETVFIISIGGNVGVGACPTANSDIFYFNGLKNADNGHVIGRQGELVVRHRHGGVHVARLEYQPCA